MIENADYFIRLVDFPVCSCGGLVKLNDDGTFTILLNSRLSHQQNINSLRHELSHIYHDDFYRCVTVAMMESEAVS